MKDLTIQLAKSDSLSDVYRSTLKEIEAVFDSVMPVDDEMDTGQAGRKLSTRLTNKLNEVNDLLLEKEKELKVLNSRLINSNKKVSEMSAKIEDLNSEIRGKESVILSLNEATKKLEKQIAEQSSQIESLTQDNQKLNEALETKTDTLNSAYFIAGSEDELRDKAIIDKIGGFLGFLGRVNALNPELDKNQLEMIDIRGKNDLYPGCRKKAYEIYLERKGLYAPPEADWLQAEAELRRAHTKKERKKNL